MKYLLLILFAVSLVCSGVVPEVHAFKDTNMEELLQKAAEGDPAAQTQLGVAYMKGTGVEVDKQKGIELYRKASEQGYEQGLWNLAWAYIKGHGVKEDYNEAVKYLRLAAEKGFAPAEYDLGMMYLQGYGVERSRTTAIDWIVKASNHGYKEADAFLKSRGIEKVVPEAEQDQPAEKG